MMFFELEARLAFAGTWYNLIWRTYSCIDSSFGFVCVVMFKLYTWKWLKSAVMMMKY